MKLINQAIIVLLPLVIAMNTNHVDDARSLRRRPTTPAPPTTSQDSCRPLVFRMKSVCGDAVEAIQALQRGLGLPEELFQYDENGNLVQPQRQDFDFDVAEYLRELTQIALPEGMVLDWVYDMNWGGGQPLLYVRDQQKGPFATIDEYRSAVCPTSSCPSFMDQMSSVNNAPQGYMQLAVLHVMGEQFYQWWHALLNDYKIIYNQESLELTLSDIQAEEYSEQGSCGSLTNEEMDQVRAIDLEPTVTYDTDESTKIRASLIVFSKWGGFSRKTLVFAANGMSVEYEKLVDYEVCWIY